MGSNKNKSSEPNEKLKYYRELRGWSQPKLAEALGTNFETISRWENGTSRPNHTYREKLCRLFDKDAVELGLIEPLEPPELSHTLPSFPPAQMPLPDASITRKSALDHINGESLAEIDEQRDGSAYSSYASVPQKHLITPAVGMFSIGIAALLMAQDQYQWTLDELLYNTEREMKRLDDVAQQQGRKAFSRREALIFLAGLPVALLGLRQPEDTSSLPFAAEELLPLYITSIPACWRLYYAGPQEWLEVETVLPTYISHLTQLAQQSSKHQKIAASLLSQAHQLGAEITLTREDFNTSLRHCKQAALYAHVASDPNLEVASLIREANTLFYRKRPTIQLNRQALQYVKEVSPLMKGRIFSELATSCAELGQEQDALRYIGLAMDVSPNNAEDDPSYSYTHSNRYILHFNEMYVRLELNQPEEAWKAVAEASKFVPDTITPRRMELLRYFVIVSMARGDLELSKSRFEVLAAAASAFGSDLHASELFNIHQQMLARWPHERKVKELADLFLV